MNLHFATRRRLTERIAELEARAELSTWMIGHRDRQIAALRNDLSTRDHTLDVARLRLTLALFGDRTHADHDGAIVLPELDPLINSTVTRLAELDQARIQLANEPARCPTCSTLIPTPPAEGAGV